MKTLQSNYVLESKGEGDRLDRQSRMPAFDFKAELQYLKVSPGARILDAGSGSGIVTNYLTTLNSGLSVIGWDYSISNIETANIKYGQNKYLKFEQKNLLDEKSISKTSDRFDAIICRFVIRHFPEANGKKVIQHLCNILKPGGTLYLVDVEGVFGEFFPSSEFMTQSLRKIQESGDVNFHCGRKLPSYLLEAGLENVDWHISNPLFKGEELQMEHQNLVESLENAKEFVKKILGGEVPFKKFRQEYFDALTRPGFVHSYLKVMAFGQKPKQELKLVRK